MSFLIETASQLASFRRAHGGEAMLQTLKDCGGRMLVTWPVGVGKSTNIDHVIEAAVSGNDHDSVFCLCPRWLVIDERAWVKDAPADIVAKVLRPRPRELCGKRRDARWRDLESRGLSSLGKQEICGPCSQRDLCPWPNQYGKNLANADVVFATQAHLERDPFFLGQLQQWTKATNPLAIIDEDNLLLSRFTRCVGHADLKRFGSVLDRLDVSEFGKGHKRWVYLVNLLCIAPTRDLRGGDWHLPFIAPDWALAIQQVGESMFGGDFRFIAYELQVFGRSHPESRDRLANGDLMFASRPVIDQDFILYSGTSMPEFAAFRLGVNTTIASPFANHEFRHRGTSWFNIRSRLGAKRYFKKNSPQILDFFAELIFERMRSGHRPLLVAKKCFVDLCAAGIKERLHAHGMNVDVLCEEFNAERLADSNVIPLINYGMIGTNLFEDFDTAYCLTSYYVTEQELYQIVQDVVGGDGHVPLEIVTTSQPLDRRVRVKDPRYRVYDVERLATMALHQLESNVVTQAVGRVRPFTKPREIITFQGASQSNIPITGEFLTIGQARNHFGVLSGREMKRNQRRDAVQRLRAKGWTQTQVATELGVSVRTVKRHWNVIREGDTSPY